MIEQLMITNFKSFRGRHGISFKRFNFFTGLEDSGKSNLLEVFGFLSWCANPSPASPPLKDFVRFRSLKDLFSCGNTKTAIEFVLEGGINLAVKLSFKKDTFYLNVKRKGGSRERYALDHQGRPKDMFPRIPELRKLRFYTFKDLDEFPDQNPSSLLPPSGSNLFSMIASQNEVRTVLNMFLEKRNLKIVLNPHGNVPEIQQLNEKRPFVFPYKLLSDNIKRTLFHLAAIESNRDATLILDDLGTGVSSCTKDLAEQIASNRTKQYLVTTITEYLANIVQEKVKEDTMFAGCSRHPSGTTEVFTFLLNQKKAREKTKVDHRTPET